MKDEIKEILDKFDKVLENYELDKKWGQMSVDSICHLFPSEMIIIKDYITNLQEELEEEKRIEQASLNTINNLQEDYEKEHYLVDKLTRQLNDEYKNTEYQCKQKETYKSRNEKAIEYIKSPRWKIDTHIEFNKQHLLNILQGDDKSE